MLDFGWEVTTSCIPDFNVSVELNMCTLSEEERACSLAILGE